jgi:hypothetical protein
MARFVYHEAWYVYELIFIGHLSTNHWSLLPLWKTRRIAPQPPALSRKSVAPGVHEHNRSPRWVRIHNGWRWNDLLSLQGTFNLRHLDLLVIFLSFPLLDPSRSTYWRICCAKNGRNCVTRLGKLRYLFRLSLRESICRKSWHSPANFQAFCMKVHAILHSVRRRFGWTNLLWGVLPATAVYFQEAWTSNKIHGFSQENLQVFSFHARHGMISAQNHGSLPIIFESWWG